MKGVEGWKYERNDCPFNFNDLFYFFFNLHSGGWNQGPLDTAAT
jgi:hypothetical protein